MLDLARKIATTQVPPEHLAIFWLCQAGFAYKTPAGRLIYVDPYLTDAVERLFGFKRIMATPIAADEMEADLIVSTHVHEDHLDPDAMPILVRNPRHRFAGAPDCIPIYQKLGLSEDRYYRLEVGKALTFDGFSIAGVYADHGQLAPEALGILLTVGDIRVWQVGDSAYRPDQWQEIFALGIDIIVPPINGTFGNLNGVEAAKLTRDSAAKVAIPCHFWMFAEQNGNPAEFLQACKEYAPHARPVLMGQGELFMYSR